MWYCEYLDNENCKCRKKLVDELVEECTENVEEVKLAKITSAEDENKHKNKCSSCTQYIALFSIIFTINIGIGISFVYYKYMYHWYLKKMSFVLSLAPVLKQQIINVNGKYQTN